MRTQKKKIIVVAGARPNFMKIAPIVRELQKRASVFDWRLVHTGQHFDREMSDVFFTELGIPTPHLHMGAGGGSHAEQTARIMVEFEKYCKEYKPSVVVVVGDVDSTLACSIVAKKLHCTVAHVEAGLRSGDRRMPEEINRVVTDSISDIFFVTEESGVRNLEREGHAQRQIHFVGHVMIDNLFHQVARLKQIDVSSFPTTSLKDELKNYGVVTLHRPSNVDDSKILGQILQALEQVALDLPLIFPAHPRTSANLKTFGLAVSERIILCEPLAYMEFLNLWKDAAVVLTDSGGLQEETTALGVPCITLRENTERPVTVTEGTNTLVGHDLANIVAAAKCKTANGRQRTGSIPKFWDGNAAARIAAVLERS